MSIKRLSDRKLTERDGWNFGLGFWGALAAWLFILLPAGACLFWLFIVMFGR